MFNNPAELKFNTPAFSRLNTSTPASDFSASVQAGSGIILFISLLPNNGGWLFEWPSTGDSYYRIVLQGREIDRVVDVQGSMQQYVYSGSSFINYPPPLEIMPGSAGIAASEINKPYLSIQWYGSPLVFRYAVEEEIDSTWMEQFRIQEVGASVYTWDSPVLADGTSHNYRVFGYNTLDQESDPVEFDIDVVTPPEWVDTDFIIDYVGTDIVLDFIEE